MTPFIDRKSTRLNSSHANISAKMDVDADPVSYTHLPTFLRKYFPYKVQKISLNTGFTCPNRDGTKGWGGCTYCNNQTFNPDYCRTEKSITTQLEEGNAFLPINIRK